MLLLQLDIFGIFKTISKTSPHNPLFINIATISSTGQNHSPYRTVSIRLFILQHQPALQPNDNRKSFIFTFDLFLADTIVLSTKVNQFDDLRNQISKAMNEDAWLIKIVLIVGIFLASFYIEQNYLVIYLVITRYLSYLYMLLLIVSIIDFAYNFNFLLVTKYQRSETDSTEELVYSVLIIGLALIFYSGSFGFIYMAYIDADNVSQQFQTSFVVAAIFVFLGLILMKVQNKGSVLTTSI